MRHGLTREVFATAHLHFLGRRAQVGDVFFLTHQKWSVSFLVSLSPEFRTPPLDFGPVGPSDTEGTT